MPGDKVHVEERDLNSLIQSFGETAEDYKNDLAKLYARIDDVTRRDVFSGATADVFIAKFEEKRNSFNEVINTIETFEERVGVKKSEFLALVESASSRIH